MIDRWCVVAGDPTDQEWERLSPAESRAAQGIGRSHGGLTTKLHLLAEGHGRSLVKRLTPGQASDPRESVPLLDNVAVARPGGKGRPRKRLDHLLADKAYGSKANRHSPLIARSTECGR